MCCNLIAKCRNLIAKYHQLLQYSWCRDDNALYLYRCPAPSPCDSPTPCQLQPSWSPNSSYPSPMGSDLSPCYSPVLNSPVLHRSSPLYKHSCCHVVTLACLVFIKKHKPKGNILDTLSICFLPREDCQFLSTCPMYTSHLPTFLAIYSNLYWQTIEHEPANKKPLVHAWYTLFDQRHMFLISSLLRFANRTMHHVFFSL